MLRFLPWLSRILPTVAGKLCENGSFALNMFSGATCALDGVVLFVQVEELALMSRIRNTSSSAPPTPRVEHGVAMTQQVRDDVTTS